MPIIPVPDRDRLWLEYNRPKHKVPRLCFGAGWYFWHRVARWWKVSPGLAILQSLYYLAVAAIMLVTYLQSNPAGKSAATTGSTSSAPPKWHNATLLASTAVIGWYKAKSGRAGEVHEGERRETVRALLSRLNQSGAVDPDRLGNQHEARLIELCECVRRDVQEFLQIPESDVGILIIEHVRLAEDGEHGGELLEIARDRPNTHGFFGKGSHAPLEAFSYEAIRRRRMAAFHDLRAVNVKGIYGEMAVDYRSVFCLPMARPGESNPFAILSVQLKTPYLLWPKRDDRLDRRLSLYLELITMFLPRR